MQGFPQAGVSGHKSALKVGTLEGQRIAVLGGREHYYEHGRADAMRLPLEVLQALGAEGLILTNAAGSMHPDLDPDCASKIIYNCANLIATALFGGGTKKEVRKIVSSLVDGYLNGYRKR